eukprot:COSAG02_NODE_591_length_19862_cov_8.047918_15_plen_127_part_00
MMRAVRLRTAHYQRLPCPYPAQSNARCAAGKGGAAGGGLRAAHTAAAAPEEKLVRHLPSRPLLVPPAPLFLLAVIVPAYGTAQCSAAYWTHSSACPALAPSPASSACPSCPVAPAAMVWHGVESEA